MRRRPSGEREKKVTGDNNKRYSQPTLGMALQLVFFSLCGHLATTAIRAIHVVDVIDLARGFFYRMTLIGVFW